MMLQRDWMQTPFPWQQRRWQRHSALANLQKAERIQLFFGEGKCN